MLEARLSRIRAGDSVVGGADGGQPPMQMGPALLPTPLSPACGRPLLVMRPANLPLHLPGAMLGARCLASRCLALRPACQRFVTGARAGIRLRSGLVLRLSSGRSLPMFAAAPSHLPRPSSLYRSQELRLGGLRRFRCTSARPGSGPVRCHRVAPTLELSRLAFRRSLLQALSRPARGQMPPPSLG